LIGLPAIVAVFRPPAWRAPEWGARYTSGEKSLDFSILKLLLPCCTLPWRETFLPALHA